MGIYVNHFGKDLKIDSRIAARLIQQHPQYKQGQMIRLLSCNTGNVTDGFAQNLANKMGVKVEAPVDVLWALKSGHYFVAPRSESNAKLPGPVIKNGFKVFYPGGEKHE